MPPRDKEVWRHLFRRADWATGIIPDRWQPKSLRDLARVTHMNVTTVCRSLAHLDSHEWVDRQREPPGRGHSTSYQVLPGVDCDCTDGRKIPGGPASDAERARRYRARKKALRGSVTQASGSVAESRDGTSPEASRDAVTAEEKALQYAVTPGEKALQYAVTKRCASRDEPAGQGHFPGKEGSKRGEVERGRPELAEPAPAWPAPPDDEDAAFDAALQTLTDILGPIEIISDVRTPPVCIACSEPARRACRTCWAHAPLELTAGRQP
jgi:hypothetical protein